MKSFRAKEQTFQSTTLSILRHFELSIHLTHHLCSNTEHNNSHVEMSQCMTKGVL